jgi:hypothetical protein
MDINLDDDLVDYLIFEAGTLEKIGKNDSLMVEYEKIIKLVEAGKGIKDHSKNTDDILDDNYSDDYGNDFEEAKNSEKLEESNEHKVNVSAPKESEPQQPTGGDEGELDEEIDDEQMISIAENCLIRIAEELLNKKMTIRQLFKGEIIEEEIEGEKIELLFPTSILDGIQKLGINEFSDLENACLINILAKPQLENTILLDELIDIMENLGIPEDAMSQADEEAIESPQNVQQDSQQNKGKKGKINVEKLSDDAKTLLLNFLLYLEQESMTPANFFESVKYEQMVKTKKKQSTVDIVPAEDFFRLLEETYDVVSDVNLTDSVKRELQE